MFIQRSIIDSPHSYIPFKSTSDLNRPPSLDIPLQSIGSTSPWEDFWIRAKEAHMVDQNGDPTEEILKLYSMPELNANEVQAIIDLVEEIRQGKLKSINFTLLHYFLNLIEEAAKRGLTITSINLIGGKLPSLLKDYYIRNLNYIYKQQCILHKIPHKQDLVFGPVADDFDRIAPDTDFLITLNKRELLTPITLGTHYFALQLPGNQLIHEKIPIIKNEFYDTKKILPDFSLVSFVRLTGVLCMTVISVVVYSSTML